MIAKALTLVMAHSFFTAAVLMDATHTMKHVAAGLMWLCLYFMLTVLDTTTQDK